MIFLIFVSLSIYIIIISTNIKRFDKYQIIYLNLVMNVHIYKNKGENKMNKKCKNDQ